MEEYIPQVEAAAPDGRDHNSGEADPTQRGSETAFGEKPLEEPSTTHITFADPDL